jgi:hypothetical protein
MAEHLRYDPDDKDFIDLVLEDRFKEEAAMYKRLGDFFGDPQHVADWFLTPISEPPFNGQIPAVTLIRHPHEVYAYVKLLTET